MYYFHPKVVDSLLGISSGLWTVVVTFLGVIVTLFLGYIAIFGDRIRAKIFRPYLTFKDHTETNQLIPREIENGVVVAFDKYRYYRIVIKNSGKIMAEDTRVFLTYFPESPKNFVPIPLNWTHFNKFSRNISIDEPVYIDILRKKEGESMYFFCWSQEVGIPGSNVLLKFDENKTLRLQFFEKGGSCGDIKLNFSKDQDALEYTA